LARYSVLYAGTITATKSKKDTKKIQAFFKAFFFKEKRKY
jgi:hypothetical protein